MRGRTRTLTCALLVAGLLLPAGVGAATVDDAGPSIDILELDASPDGTTRMTVAVSGLAAGTTAVLDQLEVVENGAVIENVELASSESLVSAGVTPGVVVALDTSGSAEGEPIALATAAAASLLDRVADSGARVGVVAFSNAAGTVAELGSAVPGDAIRALQARGGTALYDGVARAARMLSEHDGPREVVVFSDGEDTTSRSTLDDVRGLLAGTGVRVTSVVLRSDGVDVAALQAIAAVNGGRVLEVDAAEDLAVAFEAIAGDLTNRLTVVWTTTPSPTPSTTLNVVASYTVADGAVASDGVQVESPRLAAITPPVEVRPPGPLVAAFASDAGAVVAAATAGGAALLLLFLVMAAAGGRRRRGALDDRLAAYTPGVDERGRDDRLTLSQRAGGALESIPRPSNLDSRIATSIEHADWPLRVGEFLLLSFASAVLGGLLGGVLLGSALLGLLLTLMGVAAPWMALRVAISRRRAAFAEQLPTVLQVIAGSLRAGHAFSTALDGAVDEVDEPAKSELRRAAVEARLGRPIDRALDGVAERMDSIDLKWVIGALEVQREVGGNLAEILTNVAATLRERASVGRHVKALTAEGRLSAKFIGAMPFVMFAYLSATNPDYVQPLFTNPIGQLMLLTGIVLLLIGVVVLRALVKPKF